MIRYEYPLNERIRILLRLEDLFDKLDWYVAGEHPLDHHAALLTLFEIGEVTLRSDLKSELLQELERQRIALAALADNPGVETFKLDQVLESIRAAYSGIHAMPGRVGHHLKEDEWLMAIKQRAVIPGGLCEFDLPSYHRWLHVAVDRRKQDLQAWLEPMLPVRSSIGIILQLLRKGSDPQLLTAKGGLFQLMMEGRQAQMLRVGLEDDCLCVPEISANKYALNIRFISCTPGQPKVCPESLEFELTFCSL
ncbi:MAG: cell division protein ZapD [Thiobacillaceae bacterium]